MMWKRIHEQVHTSQRTSRGKEKQTNTKLVADIIALAETLPPKNAPPSVIPVIERVV